MTTGPECAEVRGWESHLWRMNRSKPAISGCPAEVDLVQSQACAVCHPLVEETPLHDVLDREPAQIVGTMVVRVWH